MLSTTTQSQKAKRRLHQSGYKLTPQRLAILRAVSGSGARLTPAMLCARFHRRGIRVSEATVYRTLKLLSEVGLVCPVKSGRNVGYVSRPRGRHGHLICSECGRVANFGVASMSRLEKELAAETGFIISERHLDFYGRCPACIGGSR